MALNCNGVAQRRKDPQRDGIATLWISKDMISYGIEEQCFAMICKGEDRRGFAKCRNGMEEPGSATAMLGLHPKRIAMARNGGD